MPPNFGGFAPRPLVICQHIPALFTETLSVAPTVQKQFGLPSKAHSRPQLLCAAPTKRGTLWESRGSWGYLCPLTGLAVFYSRGGLVVNTFFKKVLIQDTKVILHGPELF